MLSHPLRSLSIALWLLLTQCSYSDRGVTVRWQVQPENRQLVYQGMDCFFLSVRGPGIESTLSPGDLGSSVIAECLNLGQISEVVSASALTTTGVTMSVPAGTNRTIRAFGLKVPGGNCQSSLPLQFAQSLPGLYRISSVQKDLTQPVEAVTLPDQTATATNQVPQCGNVKQFVYALVDDTPDKIELGQVNPLTGALLDSVGQDAGVPPLDSACFDPLSEYITYVSGTSAGLCAVEPTTGKVVEACNTASGIPDAGTNAVRRCRFSPDGRFVYLALDRSGETTVAAFTVDRANDAITFLSQTADLSSGSGNQIVSLELGPTAIYAHVGGTPKVILRNTANGEFLGVTGDGNDLEKYVFHPFLSLGYGLDTMGPVLRGGALLANGLVSDATNTNFGESEPADDVKRVCIAPNGEAVYGTVFDTSSGNFSIVRQPMDSNGAFTGAPVAETIPSAASLGDCRIHESGKTFYVAEGGLNVVSAYPIKPDGTLDVGEVLTLDTELPLQLGLMTFPQP